MAYECNFRPKRRCLIVGRLLALARGALLTSLLLWAGAVIAGEVYGKVTKEGEPVAGGILTVRKHGDNQSAGMTVKIDNRGQYRVFLAPGRYTVTLNDDTGTETLHSLRVSIHQDLLF